MKNRLFEKICIITIGIFILGGIAYALNISRVKTWGAEVLTHTDLNAEFDNIINHQIVSADITDGTIVNADINSSAGITYAKLNLAGAPYDSLDVITVGTNGDYTTIQGALNAASSGDTILVSEGTYTEAITFGDDNVTLKATGSKENTTITQTAATVVNFSTYEGCVLEGFTVSITAVDGATDYPIQGANDTTVNTPDIIRNCKIVAATTAASFHYYGIELTDGYFIFENCLFDFDENRNSSYNWGAIHSNGADKLTLKQCWIDVDSTNNSTGANLAIYSESATACTMDIWDTDINVNSALTTTGTIHSVSVGSGAHIVSLYNTNILAQTSSTGQTRCITLASSTPTVSTYGCIFKSTNTDNDGQSIRIVTGTYNSYNDTTVDGVLYSEGTANMNMAIDNTTNLYLSVNDATVDASDIFIDFRDIDSSIGTIGGTADAAVIAYNTFTGSHYTQIIDKTGLQLHSLLEAIPEKITEFKTDKTEEYETIENEKKVKKVKKKKSNAKVKGQLFKTRICSTRQSKAAIGSYGGTDVEGRDLCLSIGTGFLIVVNKGVNIEIGDLLISSDVSGCVEKQDDNILRNYSIGKATENIVWNIGEVQRKIAVVYLGG